MTVLATDADRIVFPLLSARRAGYFFRLGCVEFCLHRVGSKYDVSGVSSVVFLGFADFSVLLRRDEYNLSSLHSIRIRQSPTQPCSSLSLPGITASSVFASLAVSCPALLDLHAENAIAVQSMARP